MKESKLITFRVPQNMDGRRLDVVLSLRVSRRMGRRMLEAGAVFVDGRRVKVASRRVYAGQEIRIPVHLPEVQRNVDWQGLVLYRDGNLVVVNKPHGIPASPTPLGEAGTLSHELGRVLGEKLMVVHRIDADTTGLMILARHRSAARLVTEAFTRHHIRKFYLAVVQGHPQEGDIELPMCRDRAGRMRVCDSGDHALTRVLWVGSPDSAGHHLVLIELITGRTHQIRVHMSHLGYPVVGDRLYGTGGGPLMLHSWHMKITGGRLGTHSWTAPTPEYWAGLTPPDIPGNY